MEKLPSTPGSPPAIAEGCLCPVLDNNFGGGKYNNSTGQLEFLMNSECPIHGSGLKLAQKAELAQPSNPDSVVEADSANPSNYVD